jgi:hypothetical protein
MVLKLPRDLLEFVQSQCTNEAYQTFIIRVLREKQQSFTQNRGNLNDERKEGVSSSTGSLG